eukprot:TRINITY_DN5875_c0_g1_i1.p1 TRINITY_DN5875_c0_g1~~TRINITY_DN5875_c0_g1_i1.p1  ORF type:complete len:742 (-),score=201.04 TRINITY_DN5875_c0_g1_i1:107-2224(-)
MAAKSPSLDVCDDPSALSSVEQKCLEVSLQKHEEIKLALKADMLITKKRESTKILALGSRHLFLCNLKGKILYDSHFLDLLELVSTSPEELSVKFRAFSFRITLAKAPQKLLEVVGHLWGMYTSNFPAPENVPVFESKFNVTPPERLAQAKALAPPAAQLSGCGGFSYTYISACDWMGTTPRPVICWDTDNLYPSAGNKEFNFYNFRNENLTTNDLKPLMCSLQYNNWFTSLVIKEYALPKDAVPLIANVMRQNRYIEKLVVASCGLNKETVTELCDALVSNKNLCLTYLDLSSNNLEDKGLVAVGTALEQITVPLQYLDVSNCNAGKNGTATFLESLSNSATIMASLRFFNFAGNSLHVEGSTTMCKVANTAASLCALNVADCTTNFEFLKSLKSQSLRSIDSSSVPLTTNKADTCRKFVTSLKNLDSLDTVSIARCQLSVDALQILVAPDSRIMMSVTALNVSDNDLGDDGLIALFDSLVNHSTLTTLAINRNFVKRSRNRAKMINRLTALVESDKCPLTQLEMEGNARGQLKGDIVPFLFSLMSNKSLTVLNISGHALGDARTEILSRVFTVNNSLRSLTWDDNHTTLDGFKNFALALERNTTLTTLIMPALDIAHEIARLGGSAPQLLEILAEIQQRVYTNAAANGGANSVLARPKVVVRKAKPKGIDTMSATKLFSQLSEFMAETGEGEPAPETPVALTS